MKPTRIRIITIGSAMTVGVVVLVLLSDWRNDRPHADRPGISVPAVPIETGITVVDHVTPTSSQIRVRIPEHSPLAEMRGLSYWLYRGEGDNWVPVAQMVEGYSANGAMPGRVAKPNTVVPGLAIGLSGPAEFMLPLPPDLVEGTYFLCHDVTKAVCASFTVVAA